MGGAFYSKHNFLFFSPNRMTLAPAVLWLFCSQCSIGLQCVSKKKEHNSATTSPTEKKIIRVPLFFMLVLYIISRSYL